VKLLKFVGVVSLIIIATLLGAFYWADLQAKKGYSQIEWLIDAGMPFRELMVVSEGTQGRQFDEFTMSVLRKLPKEKAIKYKNSFCMDMKPSCINTNLITVNYFSFFVGDRYGEISEVALLNAKSFYDENPSECALDFEISKLNYELEKLRRIKNDKKSVGNQSRKLISLIGKTGGLEFDVFSKSCVENLTENVSHYNLYAFLISELMYFAGDGFKQGVEYLLSFDSVANHILAKA